MNENNKTDIKRLLNLYYEGKTSVNDEIIIRNYLSRPDCDPEFDDDKMFFEALAGNNDTIEVPTELQHRLSQAIDQWEEAERNATAVHRRRFRLISLRPSIGIAASIALLFALGTMRFGNQSITREPVDTFTDPMEAYAETQRVLTLFANTIDKSTQGMETAERCQDKAIRIALEQLNKI